MVILEDYESCLRPRKDRIVERSETEQPYSEPNSWQLLIAVLISSTWMCNCKVPHVILVEVSYCSKRNTIIASSYLDIYLIPRLHKNAISLFRLRNEDCDQKAGARPRCPCEVCFHRDLTSRRVDLHLAVTFCCFIPLSTVATAIYVLAIAKGHEDDFNGSAGLIEKLAVSLSSHLFVPSLPSSVIPRCPNS